MAKRTFKDAPTDCRCKATITLRDKSTAQCGRRATHGAFCFQHFHADTIVIRATMKAPDPDGVTRLAKGEPLIRYDTPTPRSK